MKKMRLKRNEAVRYFAAIFVMVTCALTAEACTSAIISGKLTKDGRPLMWKNRDTGNLDNCVRHMKGEKYDFIAVTGYGANPRSVWIGTNSAGFSILNTLSYNLSDPDKNERVSTRNGALMKRALEICGSVEDFRNYLDTLSKPMKVEANYGVIDALGNGAYFEVDNYRYTMFDVNDSVVAPHGYLVRTNFSFTGLHDKGGGYVRYQEAERKIFEESATHAITPGWIIGNLSRNFSNPLMGIDLRSGDFNKPKTNGWFVEQDFIARRSTSCAAVIHGVKPGEDPSFTTMWTVIGYPPVTPAIPVWVTGADSKLPRLLSTPYPDGRVMSPLCGGASALRDMVYNYRRGSLTENYFNWEKLHNNKGDGYMQLNAMIEDELYTRIHMALVSSRKGKTLSPEIVFRIYDEVDACVTELYGRHFGIDLQE